MSALDCLGNRRFRIAFLRQHARVCEFVHILSSSNKSTQLLFTSHSDFNFDYLLPFLVAANSFYAFNKKWISIGADCISLLFLLLPLVIDVFDATVSSVFLATQHKTKMLEFLSASLCGVMKNEKWKTKTIWGHSELLTVQLKWNSIWKCLHIPNFCFWQS